MLREGRTEALQDGDIAALVAHHHDQRGKNIEYRHDDHQGKNDEHDRLGELYRTKEIHVLAAPVADIESAAQRPGEFGRNSAGLQDVRHGEPQSGRFSAGAKQSRRILQVHVDQAAIVFEHAGLEHTGDLQSSHAWRQTGGRDRTVSQDEHDRIPHADTQNAQPMRYR